MNVLFYIFCQYFKLCFLVKSLKVKVPKVKMPPKMPPRRKIVRKLPVVKRPEWEGKGCLIVRVRDLSLKEDANVWAEMSKVTSFVHKSDWICRQEV